MTETAAPRWTQVRNKDELEAFYRSALPKIKEAAEQCGYAVGVHGSLRRDLDLIAVPWKEEHADKDALAHAIMKAACGMTISGFQWEQKPCCRVAVSFPVCWTEWNETNLGHIDLSVMDLSGAESEVELYRSQLQDATVRLAQAQEAARTEETPTERDWNQLFQAATMGGDPKLKALANIPDLWPNEWHQDCAMVAFVIHGMQERMRWLTDLLKHCPHTEIAYNDDPDEGPVGWSIITQGCTRLELRGPTLEACIDLGIKAQPDEDGDVVAQVSPRGTP